MKPSQKRRRQRRRRRRQGARKRDEEECEAPRGRRLGEVRFEVWWCSSKCPSVSDARMYSSCLDSIRRVASLGAEHRKSKDVIYHPRGGAGYRLSLRKTRSAIARPWLWNSNIKQNRHAEQQQQQGERGAPASCVLFKYHAYRLVSRTQASYGNTPRPPPHTHIPYGHRPAVSPPYPALGAA